MGGDDHPIQAARHQLCILGEHFLLPTLLLCGSFQEAQMNHHFKYSLWQFIFFIHTSGSASLFLSTSEVHPVAAWNIVAVSATKLPPKKSIRIACSYPCMATSRSGLVSRATVAGLPSRVRINPGRGDRSCCANPFSSDVLRIRVKKPPPTADPKLPANPRDMAIKELTI